MPKILTIRIEELKKTNQLFFNKIGRVQEEKDTEVSKIESELKQVKFSNDNLKLDYETCEKKFKDAEKFLKSEVLKNKKLTDELAASKEKALQIENKLKRQNSSVEELASPQTPLTPSTKDKTFTKTMHNPLKSSNTSLARTSSNQDGLLPRDSNRGQETVDSAELATLKKTIATLEKTVKQLESEKAALEAKVSTSGTFVARRDAELHEMKKSIEEKAELIATLQDENKSLLSKAQILKEKRDLGLKEIQKLRDKIESLKAQQSLNDSLNTSFSMGGLNDSVNLSVHEKAQISDLLHL